MTENQKLFLEKASQDENLQQKGKKIGSKDHAAVIELAKSVEIIGGEGINRVIFPSGYKVRNV